MSELGKRGWGIIVWIAKSCTWGLITRISVIGWQFIILKWQEMEIHRIYQWITENLWTSDWLGCEKCKWNPQVYHTGNVQEGLRSISGSVHLRLHLKFHTVWFNYVQQRRTHGYSEEQNPCFWQETCRGCLIRWRLLENVFVL